MPAPVDLQRLASGVSVCVLAAVMVGAGGLTLLSRSDWWCEQQARSEVEALRTVARTHFPEAHLRPRADVDCHGDGVRAGVRTDLSGPTAATAARRLRDAGWSGAGGHLRSPDGRWQATVTRRDHQAQVHLATLED